jgi:hypothetical protein
MPRQVALEQALDAGEQAEFIDADQRHRLALAPGTTGDLGRDQHLDASLFEVGQRLGARTLALVAVDRRGADAVAFELLRQAVGTVLGAREDQHLAPVPGEDQVREQLALAFAIDRVDDLRDQFGRHVASRDLDLDRRIEQAVGQLAYVVGVGRREQQGLALPGQQRDHLANVVDETHVEHAVRLVQDQDLDP